MKTRQYIRLMVALCLFLSPLFATASHIIGGSLSYRYIGKIGTNERYEVTLSLYADCINGQVDAIGADNPAFLAVYETGTKRLYYSDTAVYATSRNSVIGDSINVCNIDLPVCVLERKFKKTIDLPASTLGYTVVYQRCCNAASFVNIQAPGDNGLTYSCTITPSQHNNCAVFKQLADRIASIHDSLKIDLSATDADGDSLSYELTEILAGATPANVKPIPAAPPYPNLIFNAPCSVANPMGIISGMSLDPKTGLLACQPDRMGRYMVAMNCIEWKGAVIVNKVYRQFFVTVAVGAVRSGIDVSFRDTAVLSGTFLQLKAAGGTKYHWYSADSLSNDTIPDPVVYLADLGIHVFRVIITSAKGCVQVRTINVGVIERSDIVMPSAFSPNSDGWNDIFRPKMVGHCDIVFLKVFSRNGRMVYDGTTGWDGRYNGEPQDMGTYFWELKYTNSQGNTLFQKGDVTLVG